MALLCSSDGPLRFAPTTTVFFPKLPPLLHLAQLLPHGRRAHDAHAVALPLPLVQVALLLRVRHILLQLQARARGRRRGRRGSGSDDRRHAAHHARPSGGEPAHLLRSDQELFGGESGLQAGQGLGRPPHRPHVALGALGVLGLRVVVCAGLEGRHLSRPAAAPAAGQSPGTPPRLTRHAALHNEVPDILGDLGAQRAEQGGLGCGAMP